ncbi:hypothetical protein HYV64_04870 [Candidatus Shapirobacteria bacterium]|nr:hypothetical protein [Candidatus Shapirobacteria bacterium]
MDDLNHIQKTTYEYAEKLAKDFYIGKLQGTKVYSPALKKHIYFTHSGWNHFVEKDRSVNELITRFFALPRVVGVLKKCRKYCDYNQRKKKYLIVEYWSFEAEVDNVLVKTVVTKVGGGKPYFLSCVWLGEIKT